MRNLLVVAVMIKCKDKYLFIKQDKVGGGFSMLSTYSWWKDRRK